MFDIDGDTVPVDSEQSLYMTDDVDANHFKTQPPSEIPSERVHRGVRWSDQPTSWFCPLGTLVNVFLYGVLLKWC